MITDPNYVAPQTLRQVLYDLPIDYRLMVQRELSGSQGEEPMTVVEQVTDAIYALDRISDQFTLVY